MGRALSTTAESILMPQYLRRSRQRMPPGRAAFLIVIVGLHVAAIAAMLVVRHVVPPEALQPLMVSFVAQEPAPEPEPEPPPPEPVKPEPKPTMIATEHPTPAAIEVPPQEEPEPVESPPPAAPEIGPTEPVVIPPNFVAAYLNNPAPVYPQMSIRLREEGTVMLRVLVNPGGVADTVKIEKSSGYARLDDAAADIVRKRWRFVPAKKGDTAVAAWVLIPLSFELKKH